MAHERDGDRTLAETHLVALLNKALRQVPLVRLDAVDAVTAAFQEALDFMEANLDIGDSDDELQVTDVEAESSESDRARLSLLNAATTNASPPSSSSAAAPSSSSASPLSYASSALASSTSAVFLPAAPLTAASKLIGSTVTRDYSSPSQSKRSLSKRGSLSSAAPMPVAAAAPASSSSSSSSSKLGLGLGLSLKNASGSSTISSLPTPSIASSSSSSSTSSSSSSSASAPATKGLATAHKPSSRAQQQQPVTAAASFSTDDDLTPDSASSSSSSYSSGHSSSSQSSDNDEDVVIRVARPLTTAKNVLLSRAAGLASSREFPSPKLGPRSLGASPALGAGQREVSASNRQHAPIGIGVSASAATEEPSASSAPAPSATFLEESPLILTEATELGKDKESELSTNAALNLPEEPSETQKDLVDEALERRPDALSKMRDQVLVPVTASPKQFKSSLRLLTLAAASIEASTEENSAGNLPPAATSLDSSEAIASEHRPTLPSGTSIGPNSERERLAFTHGMSPSSFTSNGTPKPAFLRRLDSPQSHHGQLIAAKARLSMLLNRALQTLPSIKTEALAMCQNKLEKALEKLEHSTVQP